MSPPLRPSPREGLAIIVLAGGAATRFPGKLRAEFGGVPLLERVVRNVAPAATELIIAGEGAVDARFAARIGARIVPDPVRFRGPLAGLCSAMADVRAHFGVVVAGDAPFIDAVVVRALVAAWRSGDEAVVPVHTEDGVDRLEPLAALYDLPAARREAPLILEARGSMQALIERLNPRFITLAVPPQTFASVNTPADYERLLALPRA